MADVTGWFGLGLLARGLIGAALGLVIGSFLATIVMRWPQDRSVLRGRSQCDGCRRTLTALDLVPLLGWLRTRGQCRTCGARIDPVHPLVEIGAALIGLGAVVVAPPFAAFVLAVLGWLLLTLAVLDARHFWLPDTLTLTLAAIGLTVGEWVTAAPFGDRLIGAAVGYGVLLAVALGYQRLRGREGLGLGDAKLLGGIGAWLGWQGLPLVLLIASMSGLLWVLALRIGGREIRAESRIPLGTFLCLAVLPAALGAIWLRW